MPDSSIVRSKPAAPTGALATTTRSSSRARSREARTSRWRLSCRPAGGPPPHVHRREDETFYLIEGEVEFLLEEERITAGPGDFVNIPRGAVHCFRNTGAETARMVLTFTPAGIEQFFEETLEEAPNGVDAAPDNVEEVAARYVAAAPRYGLEFI